MWLNYVIVVAMLRTSYSQDFYIDSKACLLSSRNNSIIIDLSSTESYETHENLTVAISFCQKNKKQHNCPRNSFVCIHDMERNVTVDAGSKVTNITSIDDGKAFIVDIQSKSGKGTFTIMCVESREMKPMMEDTPEKTDSGFIYSIRWMSSDACPREKFSVTNSCILYTKDFSYDLRPLQQMDDFIVSLDGGRKFVIGICRNVHDTICPPSGVCQRDAHHAVSIANAQDGHLSHIEGRGIELVYNNTKGSEQTVIKFECSENATSAVIRFVEEFHGDYFFNVATDVVCPLPMMDCLVHDEKNEYYYDLSKLYRLSDNWNILEANRQTIMLNLCGPLNYIPHISCTGKKMFLCIVDEQNKTVTYGNKADFKVISPGNISLTISGPAGFYLDILIECSYKDYHPYINESYRNILFWKSLAACPSKMDRGTNCKAKNLYSNSLVDLTPLRKKDGDYIINIGEESFRMNICGNLIEKCSQNDDVSLCYKNKDGKELSIGQMGSKDLLFKDGQFMFHMEGEPCSETAIKSVISIIFLCKYSDGNMKNEPEIEHISKVGSECQFQFIWRTNYVCKEHSESPNCSLRVENKLYDLSSLTNLKENYIIKPNTSLEIVLNVCHSVIPGFRIRCLPDSGACLVYNNPEYILSSHYLEKKNRETLGLVSGSGDLKYVNGSLRLSYEAGGICEDISHGSQFTTITFFCDKSGLLTGFPIFKGVDKCEYKLEWTTRAACPKFLVETTPTVVVPTTSVLESKSVDNTTDQKPADNIQSCIFTDPKTNKKFNLTALMSETWTIIERNFNITLGVCRPIKNSFCPEKSGACSFEKDIGHYNIGDYNTDLIYEQNSLYLQYKTLKHVTKIEFICSKRELGPKFIERRETLNGFVTFISWPTHLACDKEVELNCCHGIKNLCDYYNETYEVAIDKKQSAFLRLCRPIIPRTGLLCTNSTPACIGAHNSDHSFSGEKILGKILQKPVLHKNKTVFLEYVSGSVCDSSSTLYSTRILFFCNRNTSKNYPRLHHIENDCQYVFDWGSPLLCSEKLPGNEVNCTFYGNSYDPEDFKVDKLIGHEGEYSLNFCNISPKCRSHICKKSSHSASWHDFGVRNTTVIGLEEKTPKLIINYLSQEEPSSSKCGATVEILCDSRHLSFSEPSLIQETACFIHVVLKHKLACPPSKPKIETSTLQEGNYTFVWFTLITFILMVSILSIVYWIRKRRSTSVDSILRYSKLNARSSGLSLAMESSAEENSVTFEVTHIRNVKQD